MAEDLHVIKHPDGGWAVKRQGAARSSSLHRTQAEAVAAGRRLALKSGGADVVVHRADGRLRESNSFGSDPTPPSTSRAPRGDGPRTTLRVPASLVQTVDRLATELAVSRNDALLRLALRGAQQYEQEERIAELRERRWAAVMPGAGFVGETDVPSPADAEAAVLAARDEAAEPAN
jgi:hypothetical protein